MTSQDRLTFCKYCKNRLFDSNKGLVCNSTNEKPDFDRVCPYFSRDIETLNKARQGKDGFRFRSSKKEEYYFPNLQERKVYLDCFSVYRDEFPFAMFVITIVLLLIISFSIFNDYRGFFIFFIGFIIILKSISLFIKKIKKHSILNISKKGIEICNSKVTLKWNYIIRYYVHLEIYRNNKTVKKIKFLVIEIFGYSKPITIDIFPIS